MLAADMSEGGSLADAAGGADTFLPLAVTQKVSVQRALEEIGAQTAQLDIVVNAADIEIEKTIEDTSLDEWNRIFRVNVTGMFLVSKYALLLLRKSEGARVVNLALMIGLLPTPGWPHTAPPKGRYTL